MTNMLVVMFGSLILARTGEGPFRIAWAVIAIAAAIVILWNAIKE